MQLPFWPFIESFGIEVEYSCGASRIWVSITSTPLQYSIPFPTPTDASVLNCSLISFKFISSNNSYTDAAGVLHVVGEVYNDMAPDIASDVQVIATFYDSSNKVVGTNNSFTTPRNIASGEKAPFDLMMSSASIPIEEINHYELKVDWRVK